MRTAKTINFPEINSKLAYLCGILVGDGHIGVRPHKNEYLINCGGNPRDEKDFYDFTVAFLFEELFGITVKPKLLSGGTYGINIWSKNLFNFLTKEVGLKQSPKDEKTSFPKIFLSSNDLALSFIKGLFDTDFSVSLKKNNYPVVKGSSKSKILIEEVANVLKMNGFIVSTVFDYIVFDSRFKKGHNKINLISISGHKQFLRWIKLIGTNQPKNKIKIEKWKKSSGGRI